MVVIAQISFLVDKGVSRGLNIDCCKIDFKKNISKSELLEGFMD